MIDFKGLKVNSFEGIFGKNGKILFKHIEFSKEKKKNNSKSLKLGP